MRLYGVVLAVAVGCGPVPATELDAGQWGDVDAGPPVTAWPNGCLVTPERIIQGWNCSHAERPGIYCEGGGVVLGCSMRCSQGAWTEVLDHPFCQCMSWATTSPCYLPDGGTLDGG
jgi:hypothetical protein